MVFGDIMNYGLKYAVVFEFDVMSLIWGLSPSILRMYCDGIDRLTVYNGFQVEVFYVLLWV